MNHEKRQNLEAVIQQELETILHSGLSTRIAMVLEQAFLARPVETREN